ncbi:hypothetical protein ACIBG5_10700 [Kribbella sp. NPDC050241]|uniref:hypothetical protein n=1 Tax=Kribbella sp. NPDC050241 TaxID=3364115 RepID=UPI0037A944B2
MENSTLMTAASARSRVRLDGLGVRLFVQAGPVHQPWVLRLAGADDLGVGLGAVYSLQGPTRRTMKDLVRRHAASGLQLADVLIDAGRYAGKRRVPASTPLDADWIREQHRAGIPWALTDSGYIAEGDVAGIRDVLGYGARLGPQVIVVVAVHKSWLTQRAAALRDAIDAAGVPIALMVEDDNDPFATPAAVKGLIHVVSSEVPVLSLRNDISAIGAVAFGAEAGAVGVTTSLRHFYPNREGGGGPRRGLPAAVVPQALSYRQLDRIADAYRSDPGQAYWRCPCSQCMGYTLNWLAGEKDAFVHSYLSLSIVAAHVLASPEPEDQMTSWIETCKFAQSVNLEIEGETGVPWEPPRFQAAWVKAWTTIKSNQQRRP